MKRTLREDLERIHSITYGNKMLQEQGFLDNILKKVGLSKIDEPKKADLVSSDVEEFFNTLQRSSEQGGISQQERGSMTFQKEVETMQIGLVLLGYQLPIHGVDGLFGPETAAAVRKFIQEKLENKEPISESTLSSPIGDTSVSSPYGPRWGKTHHGVDLKASSGTQIKSPLDGEVIDAEIRNNDCGGTIYIKHADGYKTRYCHCKQINVSKGDIVKKGDVVGLSGGGNGEVGQGRSTGPHLHFEVYKDGKTVNPMDHLGSEVGEFVAGSGSPKADTKATPEMLIKLIELLKQKGVKSEDLKKYIDATKRDSNYNVNVGDWQGMVNLVINNLEGGYYHPDMLKDGRVSDGRYGGSGETMFGLDREAGQTESTGPAGREFWSFIDSQNARTNWKWNYMGKDNPALESKLRQLAGDVMKPQYIDNTRRYLSPDAADIISKDPALTFNFVYATWNGPGWFQRFAKIINQEVASGNTDPKSLLRIAVDRRISSGNSLIAQGGPKVDKITNRIASSSSVA